MLIVKIKKGGGVGGVSFSCWVFNFFFYYFVGCYYVCFLVLVGLLCLFDVFLYLLFDCLL